MPAITSKSAHTVAIHGHRGARGLYPENTLSAFMGAVKLGVQALEMDVVISADGQVVVSHEAWMNHVFCTRPDGAAVEDDPGRYNLYRMPYSQIAAYDCGSRRNPDFPEQRNMPERKPLLREVIADVEAFTDLRKMLPVTYNIEIKTEQPAGLFNPEPETFVDLVYTEVKKQFVLQRVHLQSFDLQVLQAIRRKDSQVSIGLLVENTDGLEANLDRLGFLPNAYSPDFTMMEPGLVEAVQRRGMRFIPWTVNELTDMERLLDLNVDGLITDYPNRALALVQERLKAEPGA